MKIESSPRGYNRMLSLSFIPLAIALNVGIGAIVKALNAPLYLDSIGTIMATLLLGWRVGAIVGTLGFVVTAVFINPFAIYFIGTQLVIALVVDFLGKLGAYRNVFLTILSGIGLGIIAAIVSAPVITLVFQGATGNGSALVTSFFVKTGHQILQSVFLSGFSIEPIDKIIQSLLTFFILKSMPKSLLKNFNVSILEKNRFI
jgi:energy-coupling factor transport system substrate-specific component